MPLEIIRNDITKMQVDAIVNAANAELKMGGGVCGAIFAAAGVAELQRECDKLGRCEPGQAVITKAYKLPATRIIHTVGPVWRGGSHGEAGQLSFCYTNSLLLAKKYGFESIAFPLISSGVYGYPKDEALRIAVSAIGDFLLKHDMTVYLVVFDKQSYMIGEEQFASIQAYIDERYVDEHTFTYRTRLIDMAESQAVFLAPQMASMRSLEDVVGQLDESFSQMLLRLIDEKGTTDVATYKRANLDRKLFPKIRTGNGYNPSKQTALALAVALRLNLDETRDLLIKAGYALSRSHKLDIIVEFFIEAGNYNIFEINEALFAFEQPLLGG